MGAVNVLASIYLLRLEARVLGLVVAALVLGLWLLVDVVAGDDVAYYVFPLGYAAIAFGVVTVVVGAIIRGIRGPNWAKIDAETAAAHRQALAIIGADQRFD
jgi:hypothetical protein